MSVNAVSQQDSEKSLGQQFADLGARTLTGMVTALAAALLLFMAPEVGLAGGIAGVAVAGVSALLLRPHSVA